MSKKRNVNGNFVPEIESSGQNLDTVASEPISKPKQFVFKNPDFKHSNVVGTKKKPWKTLKQILSAEQNLSWPDSAITYSSLEAPPSFTPDKKYSDLSGLEAAYTDPQTKINYACAEEFAEIRKLPSDIIEGYLQLRKANTQLQ